MDVCTVCSEDMSVLMCVLVTSLDRHWQLAKSDGRFLVSSFSKAKGFSPYQQQQQQQYHIDPRYPEVKHQHWKSSHWGCDTLKIVFKLLLLFFFFIIVVVVMSWRWMALIVSWIYKWFNMHRNDDMIRYQRYCLLNLGWHIELLYSCLKSDFIVVWKATLFCLFLWGYITVLFSCVLL